MKRLALLLLALPPVVAAQITAGQWEIKVSSSLPDAPTATQALTRCLSAEDSQDPGRLFGAPGPGCEFLNPNDDGKTYRFDIVCRDPNLSLSGSGEIAYAPDRLAGSLTVRTVSGAQTLDVRSRIEARRLGPCQ